MLDAMTLSAIVFAILAAWIAAQLAQRFGPLASK